MTTLSMQDLLLAMDRENWTSNILNPLHIFLFYLFCTIKSISTIFFNVLSHQINDMKEPWTTSVMEHLFLSSSAIIWFTLTAQSIFILTGPKRLALKIGVVVIVPSCASHGFTRILLYWFPYILSVCCLQFGDVRCTTGPILHLSLLPCLNTLSSFLPTFS